MFRKSLRSILEIFAIGNRNLDPGKRFECYGYSEVVFQAMRLDA